MTLDQAWWLRIRACCSGVSFRQKAVCTAGSVMFPENGFDVLAFTCFTQRLTNFFGTCRSEEDAGKQVGLAKDGTFDCDDVNAVVDGKQRAIRFILMREQSATIQKAAQRGSHRLQGIRLDQPLAMLNERVHARLAVLTNVESI